MMVEDSLEVYMKSVPAKYRRFKKIYDSVEKLKLHYLPGKLAMVNNPSLANGRKSYEIIA